jgi:capsular polysaccharide export protein
MASAAIFARMLEAALDEHPGLPVLLKTHPDVIAGRKRAHFDALTPGQAARVTLLAANAHPPALLEAAQQVYAVTSQMGFEALLRGRPVRTFGMPFYAGWGLTQDELPAPPRRRAPHVVPLADLVHAALVEYVAYVDPETRQRCAPERVVAWMGLQRQMRERFAPRMQAVAFSQWKQPIARVLRRQHAALRRTGRGARAGRSTRRVGTRRFRHRAAGAGPDRRHAAARARQRRAAAPGQQRRLLRIEDGFLRSVGLGANWVAPLSWVIDRSGMYYDATAPSDLETLLQHADFDAATLDRARALRGAIVAAGITKYNVGAGQRGRRGRRIILVPEQVRTTRRLGRAGRTHQPRPAAGGA